MDERRQDNVIHFKKKRKGLIVGIAAVFAVCVIILLTCFHIRTIDVTGNEHYTKEQIREYVRDQGYIDNTILLMLRNKISSAYDIPFVAKLDVEYAGRHKITVTVYEKALAGCVEYMNEYVYFDQDGYVLEISPEKIEDTPCITGMSFESMELHEKLPIEDEERFRLILKMTQLINKYDLVIDSIRFTSDGEIVMQYQSIRIELGDGSRLDEQLIDLGEMLAGLEGKSGTLDLKEFDASTGTASFQITQE